MGKKRKPGVRVGGQMTEEQGKEEDQEANQISELKNMTHLKDKPCRTVKEKAMKPMSKSAL